MRRQLSALCCIGNSKLLISRIGDKVQTKSGVNRAPVSLGSVFLFFLLVLEEVGSTLSFDRSLVILDLVMNLREARVIRFLTTSLTTFVLQCSSETADHETNALKKL